ncbi:glycosyltransferase family 1 protein [soil metagenome]
MPKVLFNMASQFADKPSGVARTTFQLLESLIGKSEFDYSLRSPWTRDQLPHLLQEKPLEVLTVPRPNVLLVDVLRQALTFGDYCRRNGVDLVVNADPFGAASGGRARLTIVHDLYFRAIPGELGLRAFLTNDLIFRIMLLGTTEIVTVSNATKADLERWYPQAKGRTTTVHSASLLHASADAGKPPEIEGPYILAVGNGTKNKNFKVLAEAMAKIHQSFPRVALVYVGSDESEVIAETLKALGSSLKLIRLSGIEDERLAGLYGHAICLCVPSLYEGFCLPVLEAQALGCPVLCSNRSATPEIAGKGALLFDPTDPAELASCLERIMSDSLLSAELVQAGYRNVSQFSWDIAARQYETVFRRLLQISDRAN